MTLYVVDLFTETQAGLRLGFNEKDELEYYMFRGTGKVVGHLTRLQPFSEHGEKINLGTGAQPQPNKAAPIPKGQRTAYRPARTFPNMSEEEMHKAAEKATIAFPWDPDSSKAPLSVMSPDAYRFENGQLMAGPGCTFFQSCQTMKTQMTPRLAGITQRVMPVDEEMGVVAIRMNFGPGSTFRGSGELDVFHSFKIYDGLIRAAEAFFKQVPVGTKSGWE
jgi:hypothetical protein